MSNLRWILLFAGLAILLFLYFSGRPRKVNRSRSDYSNRQMQGMTDPLMESPNALADEKDPYAPPQVAAEEFDPADFDASDLERPDRGYALHSAAPASQYQDEQFVPAMADVHGREQLAYAAGPSGAAYMPAHATEYQPEFAPSHAPVPEQTAPMLRAVPSEPHRAEPMVAPDDAAGISLGGKIDALGARLIGRKKPSNNPPSPQEPERAEPQKVVLLHVVAPEGQVIDGELLLRVFEHRRYHFGEKNIFHSLHNGQTVFSVAKMVEPGSFDVDDICSFETPGLVLIMQLPGPVAGDVAFEVLISEAHELADALGCRVLDSKRSTLSRQTTQHLRENVRNYMHRQKYFNKAAS